MKNKPGIANLLNIYAASTGKSIADAVAEFAHLTSYAAFKQSVADALIAKIIPIRTQYLAIANEKEYLLSVLDDGRQEAQRRANKMIGKVYRKVGFL
jgi:tryptophanyl-tRNA synthetase